MKTCAFVLAVFIALALTLGGAEALVVQLRAADGLKSSVITFALSLGFALLGPALLAAAIFSREKRGRSAPTAGRVPATPRRLARPYES